MSLKNFLAIVGFSVLLLGIPQLINHGFDVSNLKESAELIKDLIK